LIKESIEEMRHADHLIERILFLDGLPNLQHLGKLHIGENVPEMLQGDLDLELAGVQDLRAAIAHSEGIADYISRDLFKNILHDEEEHIDWLETQFSLIRDIGAERYLQSEDAALSHNLRTASSTRAALWPKLALPSLT
jgi:bacterioferritin